MQLNDALQLAYRQAIAIARTEVSYPVADVPSLERVFCKLTQTPFTFETEREKLAIVKQWIVDNAP